MFLKKKLIVLKFALLMIAIATLTSCGSDASKEENVTSSSSEDSLVVEDKVDETIYLLPSPLQIASIFKKSGLKYKSGITSNFKDPSKYTKNIDKSLNLGVYSADLTYSVLNKQNQESMTYMKLSRQVADNLGIGTVFQQGDLAQRFEKNLSNEDSLAYIIAELQMATDMYLDENEQQQITSIIFSGAWIESLYIATQVYEAGKDKILNNKMAEQMGILSSIIKALKAGEKKDPAITGLIADMQSIKDLYDTLPSVINNPESTNDVGQELSLTDDEVAQLTKKIQALRAKIINS